MKKTIEFIRQSTNRRTLLHFAPLAGILLIETVLFKGIQLYYMIPFPTVLSMAGNLLLGICGDVAVLIPIFLAASFFFQGQSRRRARVVWSFYLLLMTYGLLVTAFNHGYWMATGSRLDFSLVQYWFDNMGITNKIAGSELKFDHFLLFGSLVMFLVFAISLPRYETIKQWCNRVSLSSPRRALSIIGILAILWVAAWAAPRPPGNAAPLAPAIPFKLVAQGISTWLEKPATLTIAPEDRQDGDLQFSRPPNAPKPNVVFIIFESLNWKSSDVHTPGLGATPFLAELAKNGQVIDFPYSIVPHTTKAIMPLLCGIYPFMGRQDLETAPGILPRRCLAHILGDQGYKTAFFQPAINFENRSSLVANMGFETFKGAQDYVGTGFETISYFGYEDKIVAGPSMAWVDSVKDKPFFLTYLTLASHHNYATPQSFAYRDFQKSDKDLNNYLNAVRYIDDFIKIIFGEFEKRGLLENTLFVIAGDHGEAFLEHGRRQHDLIMWEEGLRTTALLYGPAFIGGPGHIKGIRSNLDFVPTITDILKLRLDKGRFVGSSLLQPVSPQRKLFHSCWLNRECLATRNGPIKTIFHFDSSPMEVYDTFKDPFEQSNLAGKAPYNQPYLDKKKKEMLRFLNVVNQQYRERQEKLAMSGVSTQKPKIAKEIHANFADVITILGVDAPAKVSTGERITLRYLFKSELKASPDFQFFVHVVQGDNFINADHIPVFGSLPVLQWTPGTFVLDEHTVHIPTTWSSGPAKIILGFWNKRTRVRQLIFDTDLPIEGGGLVVASIDIEPTTPAVGIGIDAAREKIKDSIGFEQPPSDVEIGATFGDKIELVGVSLLRTNVMLAGTVEMRYVFKALAAIPASWKLKVSLVRKTDGFILSGDHIPVSGAYPMIFWRENEYVVDFHRLHVDMYRSKVGEYDLRLGFTDGKVPIPAQGGGGKITPAGQISLGTVTIVNRDARQ